MTVTKEAIEAARAQMRPFIPPNDETLARAIEAALQFLPIAVEGKVKQLEWQEPRQTEDDGIAQDALCSIGHYIASVSGWFIVGQTQWAPASGIEAAKAAAQSDYETRILSALISSPGDDIERCARLIEENIIKDTSGGKVLAPRQDGNRDGLFYATAIRALSPSSPGKDGGQEVEAVAIDDDTIVRLMRDNLPAKVVDELTFERHPPLFPQATYDVPTYGMECFVKAILASRPQPASTALVERLTTFDRDYPEFYWHVAKGKICAGEPLYGAIITDLRGADVAHGESDVSADEAFRLAFDALRSALSASTSREGER